MCMGQGHVGVRGQLGEAAPSSKQVSDTELGHQAWSHVLLPTRPSCGPVLVLLRAGNVPPSYSILCNGVCKIRMAFS